MYRVTQTWYNVQKPIFIPTIQSEDSSNYVLKMMWKSIKSIKKIKNIKKTFFDGKEFLLMRLVDVRISLQQDSGFSLF